MFNENEQEFNIQKEEPVVILLEDSRDTSEQNFEFSSLVMMNTENLHTKS